MLEAEIRFHKAVNPYFKQLKTIETPVNAKVITTDYRTGTCNKEDAIKIIDNMIIKHGGRKAKLKGPTRIPEWKLGRVYISETSQHPYQEKYIKAIEQAEGKPIDQIPCYSSPKIPILVCLGKEIGYVIAPIVEVKNNAT